MGSPRIVAVGAHQIELEDGFVVIRWRGPASLEDSQRVFGIMGEHRAGRACFFMIADVRESGMPDAQTRRWALDWLRKNRLSGYAYVGANRAIRVMLSLLVNVVRMLDRRQPQLRLFDTEDEARAWIAQELARQTAP